jgi:hypothetical protein
MLLLRLAKKLEKMQCGCDEWNGAPTFRQGSIGRKICTLPLPTRRKGVVSFVSKRSVVCFP